MRYLLLLLLLGGCASRSTVPEIKRAPPSECLTVCPLIAPLNSGDPNVVFIWTVELINAYGECRRMHEACVGWHKIPEPVKPPVRKYWFSNPT